MTRLEMLADREDGWQRKSELIIREHDLDDEIPELCREISEIEQNYFALDSQESPYLNKAIYLIWTRYDEKRTLRNRLQARLRHRDHPAEGDLTDADIERARTVPLEDLLEVGRGHMALCPFNKCKRFWVKGGFGFCFKCGEWADAIKYLMVAQNKSFVQAVKALQ